VKIEQGLNLDIDKKVETYNHSDSFPVYLEYKEKKVDAKGIIPKLYSSGEVLKFGIILNAGAGGINPVIFIKALLDINDEQLSSVEIIKVDTRFRK